MRGNKEVPDQDAELSRRVHGADDPLGDYILLYTGQIILNEINRSRLSKGGLQPPISSRPTQLNVLLSMCSRLMPARSEFPGWVRCR